MEIAVESVLKLIWIETPRIDFNLANCDEPRTIHRLLDDDIATSRRGCITINDHPCTCWSCRRVLPTQRIQTSHRCTLQRRSIRYSDDEVVQTFS